MISRTPPSISHFVCPPPSLSRLASPSSLSRAFPHQFIVVALRSGDSMRWEVQIMDREARAPTEVEMRGESNWWRWSRCSQRFSARGRILNRGGRRSYSHGGAWQDALRLLLVYGNIPKSTVANDAPELPACWLSGGCILLVGVYIQDLA